MHLAQLLKKRPAHDRSAQVFTARVLGHVVDFVARTNTSLTRLFAQVDSDGSGALDVLELQEALRKLHQDLSEMEVQDLMQ
jgi:Ca2+-binding EF-hand superfamily protein